MLNRRILEPVLPEIASERIDDLKALINAESAAGIDPDPLRRLAALLPRDSAIAEDIAGRLRLSNKARKRLACAASQLSDLPPKALAYRLGLECAVDRLLLDGRPDNAAEIAAWRTPRLPITGGVLIKRGLCEGPIVARTLKAIEDRWVTADFPTGEPFERIVADALGAAG
jgi:poly(A) polymerase